MNLPGRESPRISLRVNKELKTKIAESAKSQRWSINTWINVAIEQKLDRDQEATK